VTRAIGRALGCMTGTASKWPLRRKRHSVSQETTTPRSRSSESSACKVKSDLPANITVVPLPPKCPELNPTENVSQFLRDNWLSNRVFKSYDVVDHCCDAWNKLVDQPWRLMSIGPRWAHRF
jgi:hypothetical protein